MSSTPWPPWNPKFLKNPESVLASSILKQPGGPKRSQDGFKTSGSSRKYRQSSQMPSAAIQTLQQPLPQGSSCRCLLPSAIEKAKTWLLVFCKAIRTQPSQQHCQRNVQSCWDQWLQNEPLTSRHNCNPTLSGWSGWTANYGTYRALKLRWGAKLQKNQWWTESSTVWHCKPHCSRHNETEIECSAVCSL